MPDAHEVLGGNRKWRKALMASVITRPGEQAKENQSVMYIIALSTAKVLLQK